MKYITSLLRSFLIFLSLTTASLVMSETEVKWTPNEDAEAPLPLSNNQRQQLLQLEQVIVNAQDPQGTLVKAAQANNMKPEDLSDLLQRNRQELQAAGALTTPGGGQGRIGNPLTAIGSFIARTAIAKPKEVALCAGTFLVMAYLSWEAPRSGVVTSSRVSAFSKGRTTIWRPPPSYVQHLLSSAENNESPVTSSKTTMKDVLQILDSVEVEDGLTWHKPKALKGGKSLIQQAVTSQRTIDPEFVSYLAGPDDDEVFVDAVLDMCLENAGSVLEGRELTDLAMSQVKFIVSEGDDRYGILVVKKMGDWGRYGLLPVKVTAERHDQDESSIVLTTLKGAHWDGHLVINIKRLEHSLAVKASIIVPKPGRKIRRGVAIEIVGAISESVAASIRTNVKLQLARRSQSSRFQGSAKKRAQTRRRTRHEKETQIEEMAADRRRRWQRQNPNSGHYRPSGDRMKSPNNAVY